MRIRNVILLFLASTLFTQCGFDSQEADFDAWKNKYASAAKDKSLPKEETIYWKSSPLTIDTIYRSMKGPLNLEHINLPGKKDSIIWITGISGKATAARTNKVLSDGYMCHINLDITNPDELPWKTKTYGSDIRLFTIAEGQTSIKFPQGFGMPLPANQPLRVFAQALNHNTTGAKFDIIEEMELSYVKTSADQASLLKPLYQQAIFATKQRSGPDGKYGSPPPSIDSSITFYDSAPPASWCGVSYEIENFNPFMDQYGRTYTAHWEIDPGLEIIHSDITAVIRPKKETTVHYIAVHMHPFAQSLELVDVTQGSSLFKANVINYEEKIGIRHIDYYSSERGFTIYPDHAYELISTYECPEGETFTAMAVMYMYMLDH